MLKKKAQMKSLKKTKSLLDALFLMSKSDVALPDVA